MKNLTYKLSRDVVAKQAANLWQSLSELKSCIHITNLRKEKMINGKSLIGILSGDFKMGDLIKISYDNEVEEESIKEYFDEIGNFVK